LHILLSVYFFSTASSAMSGTNVFVGNLPPMLSDQELAGLGGNFGTVVKCTVWRDRATQISKGFGFIEYSAPYEAAAAVQGMNGQPIHGYPTPLEVKYAETPAEKLQRKALRGPTSAAPVRYHPYQAAAATAGYGNGYGYNSLLGPAYSPMGYPGAAPLVAAPVAVPKVNTEAPEEQSNVYIRGLGAGASDLTVYKLFGQLGAIASVRVEMDRATGLPKGYGFVQYYRHADAAHAVEAINGLAVEGRPLQVTFHQPRPRA